MRKSSAGAGFPYVQAVRRLVSDRADAGIDSTFPEKFGMDAIGGGRAAHDLYDDREVGTTLANRAVEWIKAHKDEPFFLYLATTNIHHPFTPARRFIGTSAAGRYGDAIHELDWMVGEVLATLDEEGLKDNTLVSSPSLLPHARASVSHTR